MCAGLIPVISKLGMPETPVYQPGLQSESLTWGQVGHTVGVFSLSRKTTHRASLDYTVRPPFSKPKKLV